MTNTPIYMPPHELAELALLDAYGLLEAADQIRFEQAFLAVSPDVQAEVRRIQTEIATDDALLPDCEPPAELKARVLDRIHAAMAMNTAGILGMDEMPFQRDTVGRIGPGGRVLGSVWTWRMAALVLLGVCLTLIVMVNTGSRHFERVFEEAMRLHTEQEVEMTLGDDFQPYLDLMRRSTSQQYLAIDGGRGMVRVSIDEVSGDIFLLAMDLDSEAGPYSFSITSAEGTTVGSVAVRADQYLDGVAMNIDPALLAGARFELRDSSGRVVATTRTA
ncbi:MAG: hypothetical protein QGG74_06105 [Phycisphaerales bacterium]|nr:hypothetical protein [Phycisphaerales bacterium]